MRCALVTEYIRQYKALHKALIVQLAWLKPTYSSKKLSVVHYGEEMFSQ